MVIILMGDRALEQTCDYYFNAADIVYHINCVDHIYCTALVQGHLNNVNSLIHELQERQVNRLQRVSDLYIKYNQGITYSNEGKMSKSKLCLPGSEGCRDLNREVLIWVVRAQPILRIERAFVQDSTHSFTNGETVPSWARLDTNYNRYLLTSGEIVLIMQVVGHHTLKNAYLRAHWQAYLHSKVGACSNIRARRRQVNEGVLSANRHYHENGDKYCFD